ncbi:MAG: metalloregulator ArsR/SmtB family transcription factor [Spirochaetales bacterium]|nr:metalloregulator ArsR/SmtB family transcription factor [Spirochaetales bacterium]
MDIEKAVLIFKTLGDDSRLKIIRLLLEKKMCVEDIAGNMSLAESTVSFHLNKLESAGLVSREKKQYYCIYKLKSGVLNHSFFSLIDDGADKIKPVNKKDSDTVIQSFFRNGKLERMPRQIKKRNVVLEFFAGKFKEGYKYSEKDINRIISGYYDDYCRIRRELVDNGYLERTNNGSEYTRPDRKEKMNQELSNDEKKKIKNEWKEQKTNGGIYCIRNLETGKILLGSSVNINGAINRAKADLGFNSHRSETLQQDWNRKGPDGFEFMILEELEPKDKPGFDFSDELEKLEQKWIAVYQPFTEKCYNTQKDVRRFTY